MGRYKHDSNCQVCKECWIANMQKCHCVHPDKIFTQQCEINYTVNNIILNIIHNSTQGTCIFIIFFSNNLQSPHRPLLVHGLSVRKCFNNIIPAATVCNFISNNCKSIVQFKNNNTRIFKLFQDLIPKFSYFKSPDVCLCQGSSQSQAFTLYKHRLEFIVENGRWLCRESSSYKRRIDHLY